MIDVLVQIWGPVSGASNCYTWITVGKISDPDSIDIDYLRPHIARCIGGSEYKPNTDVVRLIVKRNDVDEMKIMLTDFLSKTGDKPIGDRSSL